MATRKAPWAVTPLSYYEYGKPPKERWLHFIAQTAGSKWHARLAFDVKSRYSEKQLRQKELEDLCFCIDFHRVRLLDDTVTELVIMAKNCNGYQQLSLEQPSRGIEQPSRGIEQPSRGTDPATALQLWYYCREDPKRVRFPRYSGYSDKIPIRYLDDITDKKDISGGRVYEVHLRSDDETLYIYKRVESPCYVTGDTEVMEQELRNLELLRGIAGIVQMVAVVISVNPYQTVGADPSRTNVVRGILLVHHQNGTLADALAAPSLDGRWRQWAAQLTSALCHIHSKDLTHMDLKPSNVVFSSGWDAVLIDLSGIEGVTRDWLSPEMHKLEDLLSESIELRKQNDVWALGKMLLDMALAPQDEVLKVIAADAMLPATARISLSTIAARLSQ